MNEPDHPDEHEGGAPADGGRTEGVRIIGAEEAAEAADRPDVVRRRRRGQKRFGDRPDEPDDRGDLPRIRISTSDVPADDAGGDRFGAVPVVRPGGAAEVVHPEEPAPAWADDEGFAARPEPGTARSYGHARVVDEGPAADAPAADPGAEWTTDEGVRPVEPGGGTVRDDVDDATVAPDGPWPAEEPSVGGEHVAGRDQGAGEDRFPFDEEAPAVDDRPEDDEPFRPAGTGEDRFEDFDDEDSFVLPHWTEPPTGQVPKVVAAEEPDEELATYGSQPRWRDEGDRTVETDFDDLVEDAPRLGALGPDEDDAYQDVPDFFDGEADRDPLAAFGPEDDMEEAPVRTRRRAPAPGRPRGGGQGGDRPERQGGGGGGDRNLPIAILVGVALLGVGLLCFSLGGLATTLLACVVVGAASFEYFGAVQRRGYLPATLLGLVAIVGLLLATYFFALAAYPVVLTLTVVLGLLWYLWVTPGEHSVQNLGITLLGITWIGVLGSFATLFLGLGRIIEDSDDAITSNPGIGVLIAAVIAAVSHDVGAYFVGRYMGRTPLSAASPNKTQEGLIGGVLTSLVVTMVLVGFVGIAPIGPDKAQTFVFALLCALVAPLGDLCESFVKRDLGLKDMGSVLPGHGGVMDRFDALLFVLPTAYFVTILFDVWGGITA